MNAVSWKPITVVLLMAVLFRVWGTFDYSGYSGDEKIIIESAKSVMAYGTGDWKNPQLNSFIIAGTIKFFGDNPVGWRISGIAFGVASILLVYLIARQLYAEGSIPLLAASLLAFDPFDIHFCRTAMIEKPAVFFFLFFLYLLLEYCENNRHTLTSAGIAMGLAISTKGYFVFAITVAAAYAFYRQIQRAPRERCLLGAEFTAKLILLPLAIYLLTYIQWFGRGYDLLREFFQFRYDAYWIFNNNYQFLYQEILAQGGKPWEWFIKPISFGHHLFSDGQYGRFSIEINNPLFRLLVIPALFVAVRNTVAKKCLQELLPPLLFGSCYLLFFLVKRPMNSYSALVLLPFAYLALSHAVAVTANRYGCEKEAATIFLAVAFISGCYLFPLTAGFLVPTSIYSPILSFTHLTRVF